MPPNVDLLEAGAMGVLALVIVLVLQFAFKQMTKSSEFAQKITEDTLARMQEANKQQQEIVAENGKTNKALTEAFRTLTIEITKTQEEMQKAVEGVLEAETKRQQEHAKLSGDHQEMLRCIEKMPVAAGDR